MELSPVVSALITVFEEQRPVVSTDHHYAVSKTVSILANLYEKARNAVEFRAEHLIRRAATERILKRRLLLNGGSQTIGENLIVELLWARYIDSSQVNERTVAQIQSIINRYLTLKYKLIDREGTHAGSWDTIIGIASSEIEETLIPSKKRQALVDFFYQYIRSSVTLTKFNEKEGDILTYCAIEKGFAQSDDPVIMYHVLTLIQPQWFTTVSEEDIIQGGTKLLANIASVKSLLINRQLESLNRYVKKLSPPMLLLRDYFIDVGDKARNIITDPVQFEQKLTEIAQKRYQQIGSKVRRSVIRSVIYIFLTKMVFALALEGPFDLLIAKKVAMFPLLVNLILPPILLYIVAGFVTIPGSDNTKRLIGQINKIIYSFEEAKNSVTAYVPKPLIKRPFLTAIFSLIYLVTFAITFGAISWILTGFHFNIASQIIFFFFITLVSFFAYRIRISAKEYEMVERQGFLSPLIDFFFLPILRVGHILSNEIAKINIFIIFFDFILEAPLKEIFDVLEEWIRFVRTKKEEIV